MLTFARGEMQRETVRLGDVVIGEVAPYAASDKYSVTFSLRLPDGYSTQLRPARSFREARKVIQKEVSEWFLRAGVFYPDQLIELAYVGADGALAYAAEAE